MSGTVPTPPRGGRLGWLRATLKDKRECAGQRGAAGEAIKSQRDVSGKGALQAQALTRGQTQ